MFGILVIIITECLQQHRQFLAETHSICTERLDSPSILSNSSSSTSSTLSLSPSPRGRRFWSCFSCWRFLKKLSNKKTSLTGEKRLSKLKYRNFRTISCAFFFFLSIFLGFLCLYDSDRDEWGRERERGSDMRQGTSSRIRARVGRVEDWASVYGRRR